MGHTVLVEIAEGAAFVVASLPLAYLLYALVCVFLWKPRGAPAVMARPPVTILKPVCGLEADLYENLKTFCEQDYPAYQIVFGVHATDDEALPVLRRLMAEHPGLDIALAIDAGRPRLNPKISNLINMYSHAKHDLLVIADSDVHVGGAFVDSVVRCLLDERVGVVYCP
jgi:ceramide glucosyltransferase